MYRKVNASRMMDGLVSVIVPIYNAERYLKNIIEDILAQTYTKLEIILVNDGSKDASQEIIQNYAKSDSRICVINATNGGPSAARNLGLDIAQGEYIRFIDADDRIAPNSIEEMVNVYKKNKDIDLVIGNYISIPEKNLVTGINVKNELVGCEEFLNIFMENIRAFYIGVPWNKLYKRVIIEQNHIRFEDSIRWSEDFLFNIEYFEKCKLFYMLYIENGIYEYYLRDSSITHAMEKQEDKAILQKIDRLRYERAKEYCEKNGKREIFELEWNYSYIYAELTELSKYNSKEKVLRRYKKFKAKLLDSHTYDYINMKARNTDIRMWKILEYLIRKKHYICTFYLFLVKGYMVNNMQTLTKSIKRLLNHYMPPNL